MTYCGDVGETCGHCRYRITQDADGTLGCGCSTESDTGTADDEWAAFDAIQCDVCKSGVAYPLGRLGNLNHFRCRQCGAETSQEAT